MTVDVWDQMMSVNLRSQMLTCKHAIPHMVERGGGGGHQHVVGRGDERRPDRTAYSVSKSAITTFTKYVATQYGRQGVRVNAIMPGLILTEPVRAQIPPALLEAYTSNLLTPYVGEPQDIADLVSLPRLARRPATSPARRSASTGACRSTVPAWASSAERATRSAIG